MHSHQGEQHRNLFGMARCPTERYREQQQYITNIMAQFGWVKTKFPFFGNRANHHCQDSTPKKTKTKLCQTETTMEKLLEDLQDVAQSSSFCGRLCHDSSLTSTLPRTPGQMMQHLEFAPSSAEFLIMCVATTCCCSAAQAHNDMLCKTH